MSFHKAFSNTCTHLAYTAAGVSCSVSSHMTSCFAHIVTFFSAHWECVEFSNSGRREKVLQGREHTMELSNPDP